MRTHAEAPRQIFSDGPAERALLARSVADLANGSEPIRVLEAGCGQRWPLDVNGVVLHITGVDTDADAMRIRRETHGDLDVEITGDLRSVSLPAESFDVVYCSFVLEHVAGAESVLDRIVRATKPGGRVIVRIPDGDTVYGFVAKHAPFRLQVLFKRYVEGFRDAGKPGHAPYPTIYDDIVSLRGMREYARRRELRIAAEYGSDSYLKVFGPVRKLVEWSLRLFALGSARRLTATHNNIGMVLERPSH